MEKGRRLAYYSAFWYILQLIDLSTISNKANIMKIYAICRLNAYFKNRQLKVFNAPLHALQEQPNPLKSFGNKSLVYLHCAMALPLIGSCVDRGTHLAQSKHQQMRRSDENLYIYMKRTQFGM